MVGVRACFHRGGLGKLRVLSRFTWSADPKLADYYERALLNGIMGNQNVSGEQTVALE